MFKGGMVGMMKKAQQIQDNMQQAKEEIEQLKATGTAGNSGVEITLNGSYIVSNIKIHDKLMNDKEMLEDMLLIAINNASKQIKEISDEKIKSATGGVSIPNMPF